MRCTTHHRQQVVSPTTTTHRSTNPTTMARKHTPKTRPPTEPELSAPRASFVTPEGVTVSEIPLGMPDRGRKPGGRTLLDVIDEKRPRDAHGNPIGATTKEEVEEIDVFGHAGNTFFFAVPLTILLFWLDVLVHLQYKQEAEWRLVVLRCVKAFPGESLFLVVLDIGGV